MAELLQFATQAQYTGTWFWKNDIEEWIKYGDQELDPKYSSKAIEEAFQRGDKVFDFQHGHHYRIDFEVMKQVNRSTGYRRDTMRETTHLAQRSDSHLQQKPIEPPIRKNTVTWFWRDDWQEWNKYGEQEFDTSITSQGIEEAFQNGNNEFCFYHEFPYRIDFKVMKQINGTTGTRRDIKRETSVAILDSGSKNVSEKQSTPESNIPPNWDRSQVSIDGFQGTDGGITSGANRNGYQPQKKEIVFHLGSFRHIRKFPDRKLNSFRIPTRRDVKRADHPPHQPSGSENLSEEQSTLPFIPPNSDRSQFSIDGSQGTDGGITSGANENAVQPQKKQRNLDLGRIKNLVKQPGRKIINLMTQTKQDVNSENNTSNQPSGSKNLLEKQSTLEPNIPPNWDRSQASIDGFQLVSLSRQHSEYSMVKELFTATMNTTIKNVSRIQNVELWENFTRKKKWMSHNNEGHVEERLLFHGTSSKAITGICKMNFDMRLHGKHGSLYGKGVYFAKNATYSDRYVTDAQFSKQMILARVLVGEFVQGRGKYRRPPEKAGNILFDSCVDDISNPEIFVIFEKDQMYPEYLLEYEKE